MYYKLWCPAHLKRVEEHTDDKYILLGGGGKLGTRLRPVILALEAEMGELSDQTWVPQGILLPQDKQTSGRISGGTNHALGFLSAQGSLCAELLGLYTPLSF